MAATAGSAHGVLERAFTTKNYKFSDPSLVARAQQLAQQLHVSVEAFVNQYDSYALVSDWSMEVTAQRLKMVADYLEGEQRKENARPRAGGASGGVGVAGAGLPQAARPTWEDLPDKLDYPTPSAKRQALDPAAVNPGTGSKAGTGTLGAKAGPLAGSQSQPRGTPGAAAAGTGTPQPSGQQSAAAAAQRAAAGASQGWAATPVAASGAAGRADTPSAPPSAFAQRTNRGQVVAVLNDHLPGPAARAQQRGASGGGVAVRPVGQPPLDGGEHLFMMEVLETKVHALDERIMDFADALSAATRHLAPAAGAAAAAAVAPSPALATPAPIPTPTAGTPSAAAAPGGGAAIAGTPTITPGGGTAAVGTPAITPGGGGAAAAATAAAAAEAGEAAPLQHSVADVCQQPVWVAGRVLPEAEGAPLHPEGLLLEGCREASGGARVRLDVSCLPNFRLFPGQSVCAFGLNPTGAAFVAQRLVTHIPPPPVAAAGSSGSGAVDAGLAAVAAAREGGLSMVVAAGPYSLTEDMSYSPLEELLSYCSAHPPDVLLLLGPFVDAEAPGLASGAADRTAECLLREEVLRRLAAWRAAHPAATLALMPAVRDATAPPVLPQPPLAAAAAAVGPADKVVALQNPAAAAVGPLLLAAGSSDLLKALSATELSRLPPGAAVERLPALASHVLGQRSLYPLYPAPPGACLDTCHYSQLQLPACPDLLLLPSDLAPFAKLLPHAAWEEGAPPGLRPPSCATAAASPVVVLNPGRLSKGGAGGTFAHVVVAPGPGALSERMRVEVKRV